MVAPRRWGRVALWAAVVVAAGLSLAIGSGAISAGRAEPPSLYQRTLDVAGQYRCPVCASESVAASDAPEAAEIRSLIERWLGQGKSQAQIHGYLVSDYGVSILEKPPASGVNVLVWGLPALGGALGATALGVGFARWRRAGVFGAAGPDGPAPGPVGPPVAAPAQRLFDPGDKGEDEGRLVAPQPGRRNGWLGPSSLPRRIAPVTGVALMLLAGVLLLVDRTSSQRVPGGTATGGITGIDQELQQASFLASSDPAAALALYDEVLTTDPEQPVALSAEGWMYAEAGFVAKGEGLLQKAENADPSYDPPHFYRGLVLLDDERRPAAAAKELKWYLTHGPDPTTTKAAKMALAQAEAKL